MPSRNLGRLSEIAQVAARHGFGYVLGRNRLSERDSNGDAITASDRGKRLRMMLDELGPTFVKFGQLLSTRPDVVPPDIVAELRGLQDDASAIPFEQVRDAVEAELDLRMDRAFLEFDFAPIASASIGQVHRAVLPDGQEVAVKVQRPAAGDQIEADLGLLYQAARLLRERVKALEFMDPQELVDEFARSIRLELDYGHEARNAEAFYRNFAKDERVVVPRVIRQYSTPRILTLEFLRGTKVADLDLESMRPDERRDVAYKLADAWMTMVFRHGFFHSDPHPANIFVLESGALGPRRLRAGGEADRRRHGRAHAALRGRRDGEHRRDPASPPRARRPLRPRARGRVSRASCRFSSTATTAAGSRTSTRSR